MPPAHRLSIEKLEDRTVPTLFGNPWPQSDRITLSFAPDGTDVGGAKSALSTTLSGVGSTAVWQAEIARAFQTWAAAANLNFAVVADNGTALGTAGPVQDSPNYGDIRISARPLSGNVLAVSNPFDMFSSWAGEIVLNSNKLFSKGAVSGKHDLYTVALQEAGHALGLDNSPNSASVMFTTYSAPRTGLAATDVTAIRGLYGVRAADRFDAAKANDTSMAATPLTFVTDAAGQLGDTDGTTGGKPLVAAGDLTTAADVDNYTVTTPAGTTDFTVSLLTGGVSLTGVKVTVYDSAGTKVKSAVATPPVAGKPFELAVTGAKGNAAYRIKVEGATECVFGVGRYELAVGKGGQSLAAVTKEVPEVFATPAGTQDGRDRNDGSWSFTSMFPQVDLGEARANTDARWDFTGHAEIGKAFDMDVFKVRTRADTPPVLVVAAWDTYGGQLDPLVTVTDSSGKPVTAEVLQDSRGNYSVQVSGVKPDTDYFVWVRARNPFDSTANTGKYFLGIDFRPTAITLQTFAAGTLQGATNQVYSTFNLTRSQSVWFELSGAMNFNVASGLTVYDATGKAVLTLNSKYGTVAGGNVFLQPGTYTVRIVAAAKSGTLPAYDFRARYSLESDPIGPALITDPAPAGSPTAKTADITTVYTYDPLTQMVTAFTGTSGVYTSPVGPTTTTTLVFVAAPPPPALVLATQTDLYSNPWNY